MGYYWTGLYYMVVELEAPVCCMHNGTSGLLRGREEGWMDGNGIIACVIIDFDPEWMESVILRQRRKECSV